MGEKAPRSVNDAMTKAKRGFEFGPFRFEKQGRVLTRDRKLVHLARKTADLLLVLLEHHGEVVSTEDLKKQLWGDTNVEPDSLTYQVMALRKALRDGKDGSRYIENLPKRGYRFLVSVSELTPGGEAGDVNRAFPLAIPTNEPGEGGELSTANLPAPPAARAPLWAVSTWAIVLPVVIVVIVLVLRALPSDSPQVVRYTRLTHDGQAKDPGPLLTDGPRVYFRPYPNRGAASVLQLASGATSPLSQLPDGYTLLDVSATRAEFLLARLADPGSDKRLAVLPMFGGSVRLVGEILCQSAAWSPDGRRIAYSFGSDVLVANSDGTEVRKLATFPGWLGWLRWSPDGRILSVSVGDAVNGEDEHAIWEVQTDGSGKRQWSAGPTTPSQVCCGDWSPDGRYFFFRAGRNLKGDLWAVKERPGLFERAMPMVLTTPGLTSFFGFAPSKDGKQLFAAAAQDHGELVKFDARLGQFVPYLGSKSAIWVTFSPGGQSVAFARYPDHTLWRARADGSDERQLTFPPLLVDGISWSPDGQSIMFSGRPGAGGRRDIYIIAAEGGTPQRLLVQDKEQGIPTWSPDGTRIAFGDAPKQSGVARGDEVIHVYDRARHRLTELPASNKLNSCRWSPDGRYMTAVTVDPHLTLMLFEFATNTWRSLGASHIENATWSRDSAYVYYATNGGDAGLLWRVRIADGEINQVAVHHSTIYWWSGLAPDDSPIMLRNVGGVEIYALDLKLP
jgi:Tol biopolymer transport system component/DNA-binding winged helix-turn-helix (wHTH) protein